jgi:hypothetical protein
MVISFSAENYCQLAVCITSVYSEPGVDETKNNSEASPLFSGARFFLFVVVVVVVANTGYEKHEST